MRISIVGTGAIGSYYGIMLANAGHDVDFLLRSDYEYVKKNGLKMRSAIHGDIILPKLNAYKNAIDMPKADIVLVCLKTNLNSQVLPQVIPHLTHKDSLVILVQNGLGMEQDLSALFPDLNIAGGIALIAAQKTENGVVVHQDYGNLDLGSYHVKDKSIVEEFSGLLRAAGIPSSNQDLSYLRWKKLVWNMAFNGLSVVLDKTTDQILSDGDSLKRCKTIMAEVVAAAAACGIIIPGEFVQQMIAFTEKMRPYFPSMKLDYDNARPLELEYLYSRPILMAERSGFQMAAAKEVYRELEQPDRLQTRLG